MDGTVSVHNRSFSHDSCMKLPVINVKGRKTASYCKTHADDGQVDASNKNGEHDPCTKRPIINVLDSKTALYCKRNAKHCM